MPFFSNTKKKSKINKNIQPEQQNFSILDYIQGKNYQIFKEEFSEVLRSVYKGCVRTHDSGILASIKKRFQSS